MGWRSVFVVGGVVSALVFGCGCVSSATAFTDVPASHVYARAINELARLGVVSGKGDGTFHPDDPVYRAQFAKMMCGVLGLRVEEDDSFTPFVDLGPDNRHDLYPHEYVAAVYRAGITRAGALTSSCERHATSSFIT